MLDSRPRTDFGIAALPSAPEFFNEMKPTIKKSGDPRRFDKYFPLSIQLAAVRRAEEKRARKARLRVFNAARNGESIAAPEFLGK